jgi:PAS domain S-box-containing protein
MIVLGRILQKYLSNSLYIDRHNRITKDIINTFNVKKNAAIITRDIKDLGFDRVRLFFYEKKDNVFQIIPKFQIGLRDKTNIEKFENLSRPLNEDYVANRIIQSRSPLILKIESSPHHSILEEEGLEEFAAIPIFMDKIAIGHIAVDNKYSKTPLKPLYKIFTHISRFVSLAFKQNQEDIFDYEKIKAHDDEIKKQRDRYENFINNMNSFFIAIEIDKFNIVQFNKTAEQFFNIDKKSAIGKRAVRLFDKKARPKVRDILRKTFLSGKITRGEFKTKIGNRECIIGYNTRRIHDMWHKGKYLITMAGTDITEYNKLKKELANERNILKTLINGISDGLTVINKKLMVNWANRAYRNMFGFTSKTPVFCYQAYKRKTSCPNCPAAYVLKTNNTRCLSIYDADRKRHLELILKPVKREGKKTPEILEIVQDITEQRKLMDDLEGTNRRLRKMDRNKSEFIAAVSHELRNPLTSIRSFTEILMSYKDEKKSTQQEFLGIIKEESDRLSRMIGNLLSLSWSNGAKKRWRWKKLAISAIIQKATRELSKPIKQKRIYLKTHISSDLPLVRAEEDQLLEILTNLLDNAIKYTPQKGQIIVGARKMKDKILVSVSDTGPGIPVKYNKKIFESFFRADDNNKGTGLGLAICRKIIQRHKGNIWVESKPGRGATFKFSLPIK